MKNLFVIGATGSMGMGTSTMSNILSEDFGFPVFSADKAVHALYACGSAAVGLVGGAFPEALIDGCIDRDALFDIILDNPERWGRLDEIVHPLVKKAALAFLDEQREKGAPVAVLDVPLLYEAGLDSLCDLTLCSSAPFAEQRSRVLDRPNMTEEKFRALLARQMSDDIKCGKADHVVPTGTSLAETREFLRTLFTKLGLLNEKNQPCLSGSSGSCAHYKLTKTPL